VHLSSASVTSSSSSRSWRRVTSTECTTCQSVSQSVSQSRNVLIDVECAFENIVFSFDHQVGVLYQTSTALCYVARVYSHCLHLTRSGSIRRDHPFQSLMASAQNTALIMGIRWIGSSSSYSSTHTIYIYIYIYIYHVCFLHCH